MLKGKYIWFFLLATLVYVLGLYIPVMDVDSAQYASLSREMAKTNHYLQVQFLGNDYLDKPPLLFWVTAFFFEIFGVSELTFKLGSFLFTLLGVFSTYRLGKLLYNKRTGRLAALILYSCQAFFLFNNDVRTDTILTASVIFSIWQLAEWLNSYRWKYLIGAAIGIGLAMLAKGPVGLMVPVLAISGYIIGRKSWRDFFRWKYLILLLIVAAILSPMLWGLYQQFDSHPEKLTNMVTPTGVVREKGVSGLKFYLWTQSFGRITGENVWQNDAGPFFFVHNFLWSFLPWSLLFIFALYSRIKEVTVKTLKLKKMPELLTLSGFLIPFIVLSLSAFKLPHYIFVLYPLAALLLAQWWYRDVFGKKISLHWLNTALIFQFLIAIGSLVVVYYVFFVFFPGVHWWIILTDIILIILAAFYLWRYRIGRSYLLLASFLISVMVNFSFNTWFYPRLLNYQPGNNLHRIMVENNIPREKTYSSDFFSFSFTFYTDGEVPLKNIEGLHKSLLVYDEIFVVTSANGLVNLEEKFRLEKLEYFNSFAITLLNLDFLYPDSREEKLKTIYLVKLLGPAENAQNELP